MYTFDRKYGQATMNDKLMSHVKRIFASLNKRRILWAKITGKVIEKPIKEVTRMLWPATVNYCFLPILVVFYNLAIYISFKFIFYFAPIFSLKSGSKKSVEMIHGVITASDYKPDNNYWILWHSNVWLMISCNKYRTLTLVDLEFREYNNNKENRAKNIDWCT